VLSLNTPANISTSALTRLPGLTSLDLYKASDQQCSSLAQLTGLRELKVSDGSQVFAAGLRQLVALEQLTSLEINVLGCSSAVLKEHMSDTRPQPSTDDCDFYYDSDDDDDEEEEKYAHGIFNKVCVRVCLGLVQYCATVIHNPCWCGCCAL